jgi:hypothetical protein
VGDTVDTANSFQRREKAGNALIIEHLYSLSKVIVDWGFDRSKDRIREIKDFFITDEYSLVKMSIVR